jgi:hypothetical protein
MRPSDSDKAEVAAASALCHLHRYNLCDQRRSFNASAISARTAESPIVAGIDHSPPWALFFIVSRRIFPDHVFGSRETASWRAPRASGPVCQTAPPFMSPLSWQASRERRQDHCRDHSERRRRLPVDGAV